MSLIKWDYDQSVKKVSSLLGDLKAVTIKKSTLTDDIVRELYEAREQLDNRGYASLKFPNGKFRGWLNYLEDCGLAKSTVYRWLDYYEPTEQRLLTDDEYEAKQQKKRLEEKTAQEQTRTKVSIAYKTGKKPDDWDAKCEKAYQEKVEEERQRDERIAKAKESMQRERERNEHGAGRVIVDYGRDGTSTNRIVETVRGLQWSDAEVVTFLQECYEYWMTGPESDFWATKITLGTLPDRIQVWWSTIKQKQIRQQQREAHEQRVQRLPVVPRRKVAS